MTATGKRRPPIAPAGRPLREADRGVQARDSDFPGRAQLLAGLDDPVGHADLAELVVAARVVGLLVADLAVDLQHAVVVA